MTFVGTKPFFHKGYKISLFRRAGLFRMIISKKIKFNIKYDRIKTIETIIDAVDSKHLLDAFRMVRARIDNMVLFDSQDSTLPMGLDKSNKNCNPLF